jgi:hypothetical protein
MGPNFFDKGNKREETDDQGSGTWITSFHSLISNASSLVIHQSFKSLFTNSSHVKFDHLLPLLSLLVHLLLHYEPVPPWAIVWYVQTISNDVARASPQLVPPSVTHLCHRSELNLFLCCHKSHSYDIYFKLCFHRCVLRNEITKQDPTCISF